MVRGQFLAMGLLAGLTSGCVTERGESGLSAELARVKAQNGFAVLNKSTRHAEIAAQGRRIHIETANGFCIAQESLDVSNRGVFALIADCVIEQAGNQPAADADAKELKLPESFPGVMTVSVAGKSGFDGESDADDLEALDEFLSTPQGRSLLGRGGSPDLVEVVESRQLGDARYLMVRDAGADDLGVFAKSFWRAFLPVNDRLVLVTISGFAARPVSDDELLELLALQVTQLRRANDEPVFAEEVRLAKRADARLDVGGGFVVASVPQRSNDVVPRPIPRPGSSSLVVRLEDNEMVVEDTGPAAATDIVAISSHVARPKSRLAPVRAPEAIPRPG